MLTPDYYPDFFGGIGIYTYRIAEELARFGNQITVLVISGDHLIEGPVVVERVGDVECWRFERKRKYRDNMNYSVYRLMSNSLHIIDQLDVLLKNKTFDLIHCHDYFSAFVADYLRRTVKKPIITTIHTGKMEERMFGDSLRRNLIANSSQIIFDSHYTKEYIDQTYCMDVQSEVIGCGVDIGEKRQIDCKEKYISYCGRLRQHKGAKLLIEAFHLVSNNSVLKGVNLHIAGDGEMLQELQELVNEYRLADRVVFLGKLSIADTRSQMRNSLLHIVPSYEEAFGLTGIEAMAEHTCVLVSNAGGMTDYVRDGINGAIFQAGNITELCDKIIRLLENSQLRESYAAAGYDTAKAYSWYAIAQKMQTIYMTATKQVGDKL